MSDPVKAPAHYAGDGKIACMDAMRSMLTGYQRSGVSSLRMEGSPLEASYWATCAFKYVWRWPCKNGLQDLEKARQCIEYAIDALRPKKAKEDTDSWEKLEEDCKCYPQSYCKNHGLDFTVYGSETEFALDLVRRAKALAGIF